MTYAEAKLINIVEYLQYLGMFPAVRTAEYFQYHAPGRKDKNPSLTVYHKRNDWCDYGGSTGKCGGDAAKLVQYIFNCSPAESMRILEAYTLTASFSSCELPSKPDMGFEKEGAITITEIMDIQHWHLKNYLQKRKIPLQLAMLYLKEAHYRIGKSNSIIHSLAFRNDKGGCVLRHDGQKRPRTNLAGCTTIKHPDSRNVSLFEGVFDFLSYLTYYKLQIAPDTVIVLNSVSNLSNVMPTLMEFNTVNLYLDNDKVGKETSQYLINHLPTVKNMSSEVFPNHKDFNEFLIHT
jgi:hypothetical protein